jgi:hypothetical protein
MKLIHRFGDMAPERRPQDLHMDGTGVRFKTMGMVAGIPVFVWARNTSAGGRPSKGFAARTF